MLFNRHRSHEHTLVQAYEQVFVLDVKSTLAQVAGSYYVRVLMVEVSVDQLAFR
jgi:hypothetical protein